MYGCNLLLRAGTKESAWQIRGVHVWNNDEPDFRDFRKGNDSTTKFRKILLSQALERLRTAGWKPENETLADAEALLRENVFSGTQVQNLLEFGRAVHAEMSALSEAAQRGISVEGGSMYSTTFPCHLCARHIISAGIKRVIYIEPYPKSLAQDLYSDLIDVDPTTPSAEKVSFEPFVGVAPSVYVELFRAVQRKSEDGNAIEWIDNRAQPRLKRFVPSYLLIEDIVLGRELPRRLSAGGIKPAVT
jgi:deoxycytidylate deaminase